MPYILKYRREQLNPRTDTRFNGPGELNYAMYKLALDYIKQNGLSYQHINDVMGVFACAAQEFYTQIARPYEDKKIAEAGPL